MVCGTSQLLLRLLQNKGITAFSKIKISELLVNRIRDFYNYINNSTKKKAENSVFKGFWRKVSK